MIECVGRRKNTELSKRMSECERQRLQIASLELCRHTKQHPKKVHQSTENRQTANKHATSSAQDTITLHIPLKHPGIAQTAPAVERRLSAKLQQNRVGALLLDDLRHNVLGDGKKVDLVGHALRCLLKSMMRAKHRVNVVRNAKHVAQCFWYLNEWKLVRGKNDS